MTGRLRAILPAPRPGSRGSKTPLRVPGRSGPPPEKVAEELREQAGFVWLDGGNGTHRLYARPLAVLTSRNGRSTATGPGGKVSFRCGGFDLLEAALAAWGDGNAGAALVGYLGYELARDLEDLPPPPPDDLGLPDLHLALYDSCLRWDNQGWTLEATNAWPGGTAPVVEAERLLAAARRRPDPEIPEGRLAAGPVESRPGRSAFEAAVVQVVERIGTGEIFQMNLCRRLETPL
ncbi:MAG: hypothetical protein ACLGI9_23050, partial [Thermoanaerobaculia bacterium]